MAIYSVFFSILAHSAALCDVMTPESAGELATKRRRLLSETAAPLPLVFTSHSHENSPSVCFMSHQNGGKERREGVERPYIIASALLVRQRHLKLSKSMNSLMETTDGAWLRCFLIFFLIQC